VSKVVFSKAERQERKKMLWKRSRLSESERQSDIAKNKRFKQLGDYLEAIAHNWKDVRKDDKKCPRCQKICVLDTQRDINMNKQTICSLRYRKERKTIDWEARCLSCGCMTEDMKKTIGTGFNKAMIASLRHHLNGDRAFIREALARIRSRCLNKCASCGITVISYTGSGWAQESINVIHPNIYTSQMVDESHIAISCHACNSFQNSEPWNVHMQNLIELSKQPPSTRLSNQLLDIPHNWNRTCGRRYTAQLKRDLLSRDGGYCAASGVALEFVPGYWNTVSVDRIDNNIKEHTLENCRLVAKCINYVKKYSIDETQLQEWIAHIRKIGEAQIRANCQPYML
jgi:hypothetical protein